MVATVVVVPVAWTGLSLRKLRLSYHSEFPSKGLQRGYVAVIKRCR